MKTGRTICWLALASVLWSCSRPPESSRVQYRVTGTARAAKVKYRLPQGDFEQRTVSLPFKSGKYWFHVPSRTGAAIEAQNTGASGDLRVEILVDGRPDPLVWGSKGIGSYTTNAYGIAKANCAIGVR